jgi:enamidase
MPHDAQAQATGPQKLVIRNIGLVLSGAMENPILDADTIVAENGRISFVGRLKDADQEHANTIIDANGSAITPGLIDSHVHPGGGRLDAATEPDGLDRFKSQRRRHHHDLGGRGPHAGPPARCRRPQGAGDFRAAQFANFRPSGVKVHAGAPCIEPEMVEQDFKDLATPA